MPNKQNQQKELDIVSVNYDLNKNTSQANIPHSNCMENSYANSLLAHEPLDDLVIYIQMNP